MKAMRLKVLVDISLNELVAINAPEKIKLRGRGVLQVDYAAWQIGGEPDFHTACAFDEVDLPAHRRPRS
jgi:hypothetical protein